MTKAELLTLLKRLRWISLILPLASVAGFRVMRFMLMATPALSGVLNPVASDLQVLGWIAITWACSFHTAYIAAKDHGLSRGCFAFIGAGLLSVAMFTVHVMLCWVFLDLFPLG